MKSPPLNSGKTQTVKDNFSIVSTRVRSTENSLLGEAGTYSMDSGLVLQIRPYTEIGNNFFNGLCCLTFVLCVPVLRFCYNFYKILHYEIKKWE